MRDNPRREYLRHAVDVPLEITSVSTPSARVNRGVNVSFGGLSFMFDEPLPIDQVLTVRIPTVKPPFEASARVIWCRPEGDKYLVGIQFLEATAAFRARMVEQVCFIENYRKAMLEQQGRALTTDEAATEWIRKYAGNFPDTETRPAV